MPILIYYYSAFIISLLLTCVFVAKWAKYVSIYLSVVFILIPFANLFYLKIIVSTTLAEALLCNGLLYLLSVGLHLFTLVYVLTFCKYKLNHVVVTGFFVAAVSFIFVLALSKNTIGFLYKSVSLENIGRFSYLKKEYAFGHTIYYILLFGILLTDFVLILTNMRKKTISKRNAVLILITYIMITLSFMVGRFFSQLIEVLPVSYIIFQIMMIVLVSRLVLYDINLMTSTSFAESGSLGVVSFDFSHRYLGCNQSALNFLPELEELSVDEKLKDTNKIFVNMNALMDRVSAMEKKLQKLSAGVAVDTQLPEMVFTKNDKSIKVTASYLYNGKKTAGYQLRIEDNTKAQEYIRLLNNYNSDLESEVEKKTAHIQEIMNHLMLGMAEMVQSRDNNTGGHIKRTSSVIRILADEMRKDTEFNEKYYLSDKFYDYLIKAAPMHDLGKIAVDDSILRKPGKFTSDEFEKMKIHAEEGAKIIGNILQGIESPEFIQIAENVAHYHHERFDGTGYPKGISGNDIPIEARIMSVADVYDALVSKRCYKEAIDFDRAYQIIEEGMGTQFDSSLNKYFNACRKRIEEYYTTVEK